MHVEEAKLNARVSGTAEDYRIRMLIASAREEAERETRQQMLHARWKLVMDRFPCGQFLALPHSPLVRVVSIDYTDTSGTAQTMPDTDYVVNTAETPGGIGLVFGKIWPVTLPQSGSVTITYDAGYASPITVAGAGAQFSVSGPVTWTVGDRVQFYCSGGSDARLPAPLDHDASYLIASNPSAGVYTLTDTSGNAINFTDTGAGTGRSFIGVVPNGIRSWMSLHIQCSYEKVAMPDFSSGLLDSFRTSLP